MTAPAPNPEPRDQAERDPRRAQRVFDALAATGWCLTVAALAAATGLSHRAVSQAMGQIIFRGWATRARPGCFRLTPLGRAAHRRGALIQPGPWRPHTGPRTASPSLRSKAWGVLRAKGKATIHDLLVLARRGGERAAENNLQHWLRALEAAGYVRRLAIRARGTAPTSPGAIRWQLMNDTGRGAPCVRVREGAVYDPNTRTTIPIGGRP